MNDSQIVYVGFGVETYTSTSWKTVTAAVQAVRDVGDDLQRAGVSATIIHNPTSGELAQLGPRLATAIGAVSSTPNPESLVVMWAGHAEVVDGELYLMLHDTENPEDGTKRLFDLAIQAARTGARNILVFVDVCYAGAGLGAALKGFQTAVEKGFIAGGHAPWWGVVASARGWEEARNGLFGQLLHEILINGPGDELIDASWDPHNRYIGATAFIETLCELWELDPSTKGLQQPAPLVSPTRRARIIPNPFYRPNAPTTIVDHLRLASLGQGPEEPLSEDWFTGRAEALRRAVQWIRTTTTKPGVFIVTGGAGSGKSALVGRLVALSDPGQREQIARGRRRGLPPNDQDPGLHSISAHIHARGDTLQTFTFKLAAQLLYGPTHSTVTSAELLAALAVPTRSSATEPVPVIVIDGLDEAGVDARRIVAELLQPLSRIRRLVIGTRNVAAPAIQPNLIGLLGETAIDLDHPPVEDQADLHDYVVDRLIDVDNAMDPESVASHLTERVHASFLLARIVTAQLQQRPISTDAPGWQNGIAASVREAFEHDLRRHLLTRPDGRAVARAGRALLAPLAYAKGDGLPVDLWLVLANELREEVSIAFDRGDIEWALSQLGRYIVVGSFEDEAVYRLAHQELVTILQDEVGAAPYTRINPAVATTIVGALARTYLDLLAHGAKPDEHPYLWYRFELHVVDAELAGIEWMRALAMANPEAFTATLARSLSNLGCRYSESNRFQEALTVEVEATNLFRELAVANPEMLALDLAISISNLSIRYGDMNRHDEALSAAVEAADLFRMLVVNNPTDYTPGLARVLSNLGIRYAVLNDIRGAIECANEAFNLYRSLSTSNPDAFTSELARALENLGIEYGKLHQHSEALNVANEATDLYRRLVVDNPTAFTADLARALSNLSIAYSNLRDYREALEAATEATELERSLFVSNPEVLTPRLARSLDNLGIRYAELDRNEEALEVAVEATDLYRTAFATNSVAFAPDLARSLSNLSSHYGALNRYDEALQCVEEATKLCRELFTSNPVAFGSNLAKTLANLSNRYNDVDRHSEALASEKEATDLYRRLVDLEPEAFAHDLGNSLIRLSVRYGDLNRHDEALANADAAVNLYRQLADINPGSFTHELARSIVNLGLRCLFANRPQDALDGVIKAVGIYAELAAVNSAFIGVLADSIVFCERLGQRGLLESISHTMTSSNSAVLEARVAEARPQKGHP